MASLRVTLSAVMLSAVCVFETVILAEDNGAKPDEKALQLELRLKEERQQWYVGDKVHILASLKNISDHDLFFPDWNKPRLREMLRSSCYVTGFPGEDMVDFSGYRIGAWRGGFYLRKEEFRRLKAGAKTSPLATQVPLHIPGEIYVSIRFTNPTNSYTTYLNGDQRSVRYPGAWKGTTFSGLKIQIEPEISPEMKARYERSSQMVLDEAQPLQKRLAALSQVAEEKHYFAARFVRDLHKKPQDGPVRQAALKHLVSLLTFGTAYEALPDLLRVLADESASPEIRTEILDILGKMHLTEEFAGFSIGGQAYYRLPKELHQRALEAVKRVSRESDAALKRKARIILQAGEKE